MDDDETWLEAMGRAVLYALIVLSIFCIASAAMAECVGAFETVTERYQLRYTNNDPSHPQYALGRWNRWNLIDFNVTQEIQGKPNVPALPGVCAVKLSAGIGITGGSVLIDGKVVPEAIAVWLDFTTDPSDEVCRGAYSDTANFGRGVRDTTGEWTLPLKDGRLWWAPCARSNINTTTGSIVAGPNIESPKALLKYPYSTAFVNLGLTGWVWEWPTW